ncbi:MAG TPA: hypothetical protein VG055_14235 [Planctomycetaceae bacterium]|jgi:hypothetical protein|nr:hypothetical protein [Planctomycetaceae bacterium]
MQCLLAVYQTEIPWWAFTVLIVWIFARILSRVIGSKQAFIITCCLIVVLFGFRFPVVLGPFLLFSGVVWLARYVTRRRRANLPLFDHRKVAAWLAGQPRPKLPNRRETLILAIAAVIGVLLYFSYELPLPE